jgi:flagellar basal-body rod protein FlgB
MASWSSSKDIDMSGSSDLTTQAVRLALGISQLRADVASRNIANASTPGAQAAHVDFARSQGLLEQAAAGRGSETSLLQAMAEATARPGGVERLDAPGIAINLDEQVADMSTASLEFQSLTESLNRHFGLMRLAINGRG